LGELEAKLSAYFSKVEQEKIAETVVQPPPPTAIKDVKLTLDRHSEKFERKEPVVTRLVGDFPKEIAPRERNQETSDR